MAMQLIPASTQSSALIILPIPIAAFSISMLIIRPAMLIPILVHTKL